MLDPTAAYRTSQAASASGAGQIVLLYQGAIRFATQHLAFVERGNIEGAHNASIRSQEIVTALRGSLDLAAGPIALQLDQLYDFVLGRLTNGNMAKDPHPTEEAIQVLRGLLEAWQEIAAGPASNPVDSAIEPAPVRMSAARPDYISAGTYAAGGSRR
jgi:flagellar protein FliS